MSVHLNAASEAVRIKREAQRLIGAFIENVVKKKLESLDVESMDAESMDAESMDAESMNAESMDAESMDTESMDAEDRKIS
ncbi:hypothetical protein BGX26_008856 [Mortierella sp. AD094]|nr:hypothetical protein BGX26_008856 [Mortierella sp. AD094]